MKRETKSLSLSCSMGNTQFCKTTYEPHKDAIVLFFLLMGVAQFYSQELCIDAISKA